MKLRHVMRKCPCGDVKCVGVAPMNQVRAYHAAWSPCPKCHTIGGNRIFWFAVEEVSEVNDNAAPRKERLQ